MCLEASFIVSGTHMLGADCWKETPLALESQSSQFCPGSNTPFLKLNRLSSFLVVKNPPCNAGDTGDGGLILGSGRSPGGEHSNPLWYSCQENPMDRGTWRAMVCGVPKNQTQLK